MLQQLIFYYYYVDGTLPEALSELTSLAHLDISYTQISGTVPMSIIKLKSLTYLNVEQSNIWREPYNNLNEKDKDENTPQIKVDIDTTGNNL